MELIFVYVDAVTCAISLQYFVEAKCTDVRAFSNDSLCFGKSVAFKCLEGIICLELHDHSFTSAGVEDINDAGLHEFMKSERVVAAIVKYFED